MTAELGLALLILALLTALLQAAFLLPSTTLRQCIAPCLVPAAWLQALCITLAFAILMSLRISSDFSVAVVAAHSNLTLPLLYKIAGTWGNHEGSMLLWVLVLAGFGLAFALKPMDGNAAFKACAIATQAAIGAGFLCFILWTSNPFERRFPPVADGEALNPLLQDFALSIHPPLLYIGYVGFSIVFSMAVAALLQKRMDSSWATIAHPWILASWSSLTIGIGLGSWWAYRVLGWGGFWFWDPVENASLMPWLCGTALLHSNIVLKKRGLLGQWVILLSIVTFGLSLLGTFLVRSGVLISVHSFASDPTRGLFILIYIVVVLGSALQLFALRGHHIRSGADEDPMMPLSREGLIVINNLFLLTACATVLLGTLYPMLMEWFSDDRITVGPPFFNTTFLPLVSIPLVFAGFAPFMPWRHAALSHAIRQAKPAIFATLAAMFLTFAISQQQTILAALGFGLAAWLAACSVQWLRKRTLNPASLSVFLAHTGAALLVVGITGATLWKQQAEQGMAVGDTIEIAGYRVTYADTALVTGPNYHARHSVFDIRNARGDIVTTLTPEYRTYDIRNSATSTAAIYATPLYDLYAVIGETSDDGSHTAVRIYYSPMIDFIWGGCMLMATGGIVSLARRRKT